MALKGTIKDFGVADIFQLISQQAKTGVLVLNNDVDEVRVYFREGSVIRASNTVRTAQMLLGTFMVRAEVINDTQLQQALKEQQRTLKRLGTVLVELGFATPEIITEFATLQMTETIYALFEWSIGTYEFESVDVEASPEGVQPIRSETIVMNGIRMTDEWPGIRERITNYEWHAEQLKALPAPSAPKKAESSEFDLSSLTDDPDFAGTSFDEIGPFERSVFDLIQPGRSVQKIIDLSRLGEFEACRSLTVLMGEGYVRVVKPEAPAEPEEKPSVDSGKKVLRFLGIAGRVAVSAGLVVAGAMVASHAVANVGRSGGPSELGYAPRPVEQRLAYGQMHRIRRALEVYRYEKGAYPPALEDLVEVGLLRDKDIRFPFAKPYHYRVTDGAYTLLRPVH